MCCFSCFKSSNAWKKHLKCRKVKPSNEEETLRKKKRGLCCFNGGKHSKVEQLFKDEGLSKKKKSKGCFMCKRSPKDDTTSKKKENCGMCCFHCKGSSKDEDSPRKGRKSGMWCFHGKESLRDENSARKKRKCGMCCFGADNKPSSEDTTVRKNEGRTGCFRCFGADKPKKEKPMDEKEKAKCGMCCFGADNKPSSEDTPVRKNEGRTGCFRCGKPKKEKPRDEKEKAKCGLCCFGADNKPSSEDTTTRKNEGCTGCFRCRKPKKEKPRDEKEKAKCGMRCFGAGNKPLLEDTTVKKNEGCTACFRCGKVKKEKPMDEKEKATSTCAWANPFKGKECCFCFRLCKKGDKATTMPSDGATTRPSDGKPSKQGCTKLAHCSCGCGCWSASAHLKVNKNKNGGKGMLCWKRKEKKLGQLASLVKAMSFQSDSGKHRSAAEAILNIGNGNIASRVFTYRELSEATQNFASESLLGKGGFGKVYKGYLDDTNETIAVKKLDRTGCQGNREFLIEVLMLSLLSHENLVTLLGYCADGDQRILVYEYMPNRSVQDHLFDLPPGSKPLDWNTRMKIALGAAKGLAHLHDAANPPVIFRDLKASNILVDDDFNPKLADFGLAKLGPSGPKHHVSTRVMGTFGYCAPEYALTGKLTLMSDIYTFGVVLLELITGRKAMDTSRPKNEQILVVWAKPLFKDKRNYVGMADPLLAGKFPVKALYQAVAVAAMCLQEGDTNRPLVKDIISALQYLTDAHSRIPTKEFEKCRPEVPEQQTEVSCDSNAPDEEEPWHSSQSSSASQENEEELERDADIRRPNNEDHQET